MKREKGKRKERKYKKGVKGRKKEERKYRKSKEIKKKEERKDYKG